MILSTARSTGVSQSTDEKIDRAEAQLSLTLQDLRHLASGLHPRVLSEDGLQAALTSLTENLTIPVEITVTPEHLPADVEAACYFFCAEALANVVKHASASKVWIAAHSSDGRVIVTVEDDGMGGADPSMGAGLRGLSDRLQIVGGTLRIVSEPGAGTRLTAEIPFGGENSSAG
jgi:signal transduction histidine kinase